MQIQGNTILITGGGSGIGRRFAEAFHQAGNTVIIAGRRQAALDEVVAANPGMHAMTLDIEDPAAIAEFGARIAREHPALNVVLNNAGIMRDEDLTAAPAYLDTAEATIATNLLGPIRLTAALLPQLRAQPRSAVLMVTSGLAFVPLARTPTYDATKAGLHAYTMALRHQLRNTTTEVIEIVPPYVQTELQGAAQAEDPNAMPLDAFITETMGLLAEPGVTETLVERVKPLRFAAERGTLGQMFDALASH
jgi:uncharacterized oxidoreductase